MQIGVNLSRRTYRFYRFKFRVSLSQTDVTSSPMMSGSNSPYPSPLGYQVWEQCWSLTTSCKLQPKTKYVSEFQDALQLIWSALPEKAINHAVKDLHKRL